MWISEGLLPEARAKARVAIVGKPTRLTFDEGGDLERLARL
jgi:hypothetical protein